ncbi:MAG: C25 family cysteine peptidase, partial [Ilumatobacteraceae bacterium]
TQTSIAALGGAAGPVHTCPNDGPVWTKGQLDVPLVFVNCHGAALDPTWYGEKFAHQPALPHAIDAASLRGKVRSGCVIAAECCYATMHWDPRLGLGQPSVALTFLVEGASGVFGSSTMSYGPAVGNGTADVITRMFLEAVAGGASLGRAALTARQRYVAAAGTLAPTDLKTLAQFDLLGDPSVHPVATQPTGRPPGWAPPSGPTRAPPTGPSSWPAPAAGATPAPFAGPPTGPFPGPAPRPFPGPPPGVGQRRATLTAIGTALQTSVGATLEAPRALPGLTGAQVAELSGLDPGANAVRTFDVDSAGDEAYHVTFASPAGAPASGSLVVVRSETGQAPQVRTLERK